MTYLHDSQAFEMSRGNVISGLVGGRERGKRDISSMVLDLRCSS